MKTVFNNDMTAHVWAQQNQEHGRNSTGSLYFEGAVIYSYGHHFPIAEFLNPHTVITTALDYSPTTGQHKSIVARALPSHITLLEAPHIAGQLNHKANIQYYRDRIEHFKSKAKRSHIYFYYSFEAMVNNAKMAKDYCDHFKQVGVFSHPTINNPMFKKAKLRADTREENEKKRHEKQLKKQIIYFRIDVKKWKSGNGKHLIIAYNFPVMLRIKEGEIQTSHGATIPLGDTIKNLWLTVQKCKEGRREFSPNGTRFHLGSFQLNHIDKRGNIKVGCHSIGYGELKSLARQLHYI